MLTLSQIKSICRKYNIVPAKSRGQNFLFDQNIVKKIIAAAEIKKDDIVLEVGPGLGALTFELLKQAKKVIAVELDKKLLQFLKAEFFDAKNLEIVAGDILKIDRQKILPRGDYKVVANLPYNIAANFLKIFLSEEPKPQEMILMAQKEVAQRIAAKKGKLNILALSVQFYSQPEILFYVSKNCFWPAPKVDAAVIRIKLKKELALKSEEEIKRFFRLVKIGFSAKRKQLHNNLAAGLAEIKGDNFSEKNAKIKEIIQNLGFDEKIRAQDVDLDGWIELSKKIYS